MTSMESCPFCFKTFENEEYLLHQLECNGGQG